MRFTFIRFLIVGMINTIIGLTTMYLLFHLANQSYWLSTFIGNTVGAIISFILNRSYTFKSNNAIKKSMIRFTIVIIVCYFLSYKLGTLIVNWSINDHFISSVNLQTDLAILISTCIYTVTNYFCQKQFVFRMTEQKSN